MRLGSAGQAGRVELTDIRRKIRAGRVDLLKQPGRGEIHHELSPRPDIAQRILLPHRRELHDRRIHGCHSEKRVRGKVVHAVSEVLDTHAIGRGTTTAVSSR